jgi:hypothetical protein
MTNIFNNVLELFGLFIGLIILCRVIHIFFYPLFCYLSSKISNSEINENNIIGPDNINVNIKNIPVVNVEYCSIEEKSDSNTPIAIVVL